jgi:hypothetical protein
MQEPECHETSVGEVAHDPREATGLRRMAEKGKNLFAQN